jgi:hypothetical protein
LHQLIADDISNNCFFKVESDVSMRSELSKGTLHMIAMRELCGISGRVVAVRPTFKGATKKLEARVGQLYWVSR